jgi:DNA-binding IclR family transcriptional regulator
VLLSYLPEEERKKILEQKELLHFTEKTIIDEKKLKKELDKIKKQGFALDLEEHEKDVCCIAAPIRNYQGEIIAAISISSPVYRIDIKKENYLKEALIRITKKISERLGYNKKL